MRDRHRGVPLPRHGKPRIYFVVVGCGPCPGEAYCPARGAAPSQASRPIPIPAIGGGSAPAARVVSVDTPTRFFVTAFREALLAHGVTVRGPAVDLRDIPTYAATAARWRGRYQRSCVRIKDRSRLYLLQPRLNFIEVDYTVHNNQ